MSNEQAAEVLARNAYTDDAAVDVALAMLGLPTAPFREHAPHRAVAEFVNRRAFLRSWRDSAGNLLVGYGPAEPELPLMVATAHLDHPAFEVSAVESRKARLRFLGGIHSVAVPIGAEVEFFATPTGECTGRGELRELRGAPGLVDATAEVHEGSAVTGGFAMWIVAEPSATGDLIQGRSCDDLAAAAALLVCLDRLDRDRPDGVRFWGMFSRAEELRCLGALRAIEDNTIPDGTPVVALDCTRPVNDVRFGGGVVLRVGDSRFTYDPALVQAMREIAEDTDVPWQRRLSESGWCEAAVFQATGRHPAASLTLPIRHYHNQLHDDGGGVGLSAEAVHRDDYLSLIALLTTMARRPDCWAVAGRGRRWMSGLPEKAAAEFASAPPIS